MLKLLNLLSISNFVDQMVNNRMVTGSKIQKQLQFEPEYNLDKGWYDAVTCCLYKNNLL